MKTNKHYWSYLAQFFLEREMSETAHSPSKHKDKHGFIISQCKHTEL